MKEPEAIWYGGAPIPLHLKLAEQLYRPAAALHQRWRRARARHPGVPVVIVGNLTVGGTGKTPLLIHLVRHLRSRCRVGVVSRGYGSRAGAGPVLVRPGDDAGRVGDEPLLISRETAVPVMVGSRRFDAASELVARHQVELIFSDDGLQHGQLARDLEIVVVDHARGFGNKRLLPAGPLREPLSRLDTVDFVIENGSPESMMLDLAGALKRGSGERRELASFAGGELHAVAGIGHPQRFFDALREAGLAPACHAFPDHHAYTARDFAGFEEATILTTAKDAVKIAALDLSDCWEVPVSVRLEKMLEQRLLQRIEDLVAER